MMASTTTETTALAAFTLPGSPHSARMARFYLRAALAYHGLGGYADDAEAVAAELIANAVTHAPAPGRHPRQGRLRSPASSAGRAR